MRKKFLLLLFTGLALTVYSQTDSLLFASLYTIKTEKEANEFIYNGREHTNYHSSIQGTAYYNNNEWKKGILVFENVTYKNMALKYDLVANEVMVRHPNGLTGVILYTPRIQSFTLDGKSFVYLTATPDAFYKTGIYEEAVKGRASLYIHRSKIISESILSNSLERTFVDNNSYYLVKDGKFYPIRKQGTVMELFKEKKPELNAALKRAGIKFKTNPEAALTLIVTQYNQLSL